RGKGCKVQIADSKLGVSEKGPFHYPDVMVSCDERDLQARKVIHHPCLIVEVLSPSTEAVDRGLKFRHYRRIDTLTEYVLIDPDRISVECYRLNDRGKWELIPYSIDETTPIDTEPVVEFTSVNFSCPISVLYENVVFPQDAS
ncbi:MAG: Uma2 family endonuclease, partial [Symploca sp. SIO2E6]|nr:Uma2 family endonuclease [Symploca sp. SIO2E6]